MVCPFCEGKVSEQLERLGGPCPHCFNEIPGEDAATDPGLVLRQEQRRKDALRAKKRKLRGLVVLGIVLGLGAAGGAWMFFEHQRERAEVAALMELEFEDYALMPLADIQALEAELKEAEENARNDEERKKIAEQRKRVAVQRVKLVEESAPEIANRWDDLDPGEAPKEQKTGPKTVPDVGIRDIQVDLGGGPDLGIVRGDALKGDVQTTETLRSFIQRSQAKLKRCHETALMTAPSTGGRWNLHVKMLEDGTLTDVRVKAMGNNANADFEACLVREVSRWKVPVTTDSPVAVDEPLLFAASF